VYKTHGLLTRNKSNPTYSSYADMMKRCYSPKNKCFPDYGGRGITVCDRWKGNPIQFVQDMGERLPGFSLGRIDTNGNYSPDNCQWETQKQQQNNRRNNHRLTFAGETLTLAQWTEKMGLPPFRLNQRLNRDKWTVERALTTPVLNTKFKKKP
jgi:hypothetical protein